MTVQVLAGSEAAPAPASSVSRLAAVPVLSIPPLSVVIPTLGRADLLDRCLAAIARCDWDAGDFEIVVVDDGPSESTRAAVVGWMAVMAERRIDLRYLPSPGPHGPAAARNRGWRAARGRIIAFTDDDTEPHPQWLRNGRDAFSRGAVAAWGRIVMPIPASPTDYERDANGLERAPFVTANCFCERALLERLGGFDERFRLAWREDSDLYFRLLEARVRIEHVPDAVVVHPVRPAPWGISVKQQRKVLFDALLYKKHPRLYRQRIRPRPPWRYYLIAGALLAAFGGLAVGSWPVAVGAAGFWLAGTLHFAWQRLRHTSKAAPHVVEMLLTSAVIPPLAVFWRLYGAIRFGTPFL